MDAECRQISPGDKVGAQIRYAWFFLKGKSKNNNSNNNFFFED